VKDNIWGGSSAYGKVHLNIEQIKKFQEKWNEINKRINNL